MNSLKYVEKIKQQIIFSYNNGSKETYDIRCDIYTKIHFIVHKTAKYTIIDTEQGFIDKLDGKYDKCIFINKINFKYYVHKDIDFTSCIFCRHVNFDHTIFYKDVRFTEAIFLKDVTFRHARFYEDVYFNVATFHNDIIVLHSIFKQDIYFTFVEAAMNINFNYSVFERNAYFHDLVCDNDIGFAHSIFQKEFDLSSSSLKNLDFKKINYINNKARIGISLPPFDKKISNPINFKLNLKFCSISFIRYTGCIINNASNRDTFLILKNQALKNNDQITALDFYIKEMNTYKNEAKGFDRFILWFENTTSSFGTKAYRPILLIIIFNLIFLSIFLFAECQDITNITCNKMLFYFTNSLNPTNSTKDIFGACGHGLLEFLNLLKNILTGALIYETIKSFRKYSRKI